MADGRRAGSGAGRWAGWSRQVATCCIPATACGENGTISKELKWPICLFTEG